MWLGHHSPAFTLATYVHLMTDDLAPIDDFFKSVDPLDEMGSPLSAREPLAA
jgi:hypothetical protein